jgi:alpha-2-macroglobulin
MVTALLIGLSVALLAAGYGAFAASADKPPAERRAAAAKAQQQGNFRDALEGYSKLLLDPADDAAEAPSDLSHAVECLQRLGRVDEIDDLREKAVATHAKNWRLLERAAQTYQDIEHQGFIVAGQFYRGGRRGNDGKPVHAFERDRVRALQLMQQAMKAADGEKEKREVAEFYFRFADMLLDRRFGQGAWRLQYLSDLSTLPDYEEGYPYAYYGYNPGRGAPVDEKGEPVYHHIPKSWESSKTDGERWRWCLTQGAELAPSEASRATYTFAAFLREQFDVQTMA